MTSQNYINIFSQGIFVMDPSRTAQLSLMDRMKPMTKRYNLLALYNTYYKSFHFKTEIECENLRNLINSELGEDINLAEQILKLWLKDLEIEYILEID